MQANCARRIRHNGLAPLEMCDFFGPAGLSSLSRTATAPIDTRATKLTTQELSTQKELVNPMGFCFATNPSYV